MRAEACGVTQAAVVWWPTIGSDVRVLDPAWCEDAKRGEETVRRAPDRRRQHMQDALRKNPENFAPNPLDTPPDRD